MKDSTLFYILGGMLIFAGVAHFLTHKPIRGGIWIAAAVASFIIGRIRTPKEPTW